MTHNNSWKKLSSKYVLQNPWFKVRHDEVIRPDGEKGEYNVVECGKSAFIVPITSDDKIVLVKLFRYPTQNEGWEIPAGGVDAGEQPLVAAKRELKEETGMDGGAWQEVGSFESMSGLADSMGYVFTARDLIRGNDNHQKEEGITEVAEFTFDEIIQMITNGKIVDALSIASLMQFFAKFKKLA